MTAITWPMPISLSGTSLLILPPIASVPFDSPQSFPSALSSLPVLTRRRRRRRRRKTRKEGEEEEKKGGRGGGGEEEGDDGDEDEGQQQHQH